MINASWHFSLLVAYVIAIKLSLNFIDIGFLKWITPFTQWISSILHSINLGFNPEYVEVVISALNLHLGLIFGCITLAIIWRIYLKKIVAVPEDGGPDQLQPLALAVYGVLALTKKKSLKDPVSTRRAEQSMYDHLQAALVAIDMLALAALMKAMGYLDTTRGILGISFSVFGVVFIAAWFFAFYARHIFSSQSPESGSYKGTDTEAEKNNRLKRKALLWQLTTMRVVEPLLIFYFSLELVALVIFKERIHSVGFFFGALCLVLGLVSVHSFPKVVDSSSRMAKKISPDEKKVDLSQFGKWGFFSPLAKFVGKSFLYLIISIILLSIAATSRFDSPSAVKSLDGLVSTVLCWLIIIALFCSGIAFLFRKNFRDSSNIQPLPKWARTICAKFVRFCIKFENKLGDYWIILMKHNKTLGFFLIATFVASIVPIAERVVDTAFEYIAGRDISALERAIRAGLQSNHYHAFQIAIWLLFVLVISLILHQIDKGWKLTKMVEQDGKKAERFRNSAIVPFILGAALYVLPKVADYQDKLVDISAKLKRAEDTGTTLAFVTNLFKDKNQSSLPGKERIMALFNDSLDKFIDHGIPLNEENWPLDAWGNEVKIDFFEFRTGVLVLEAVSAGEDGRLMTRDDIIRPMTIFRNIEQQYFQN